MIILTSRTQIKSVAERWRMQYGGGENPWRDVYPIVGDKSTAVNSKTIYEQLLALPETATKEDVGKVMYGTSWIDLHCSNCGKLVDKIALLGNDSCCAYLCVHCLQEAVNVMEETHTSSTAS